MTEIEGRTYYYKEVEESASRLADLLTLTMRHPFHEQG